MRKIRAGTLAEEIKYTSADRSEFLYLCNHADNYQVVQLKYDGWWCAITPEGLYTKNGLLRSRNIHSFEEDIFIGEYLFGTQWSEKNHFYKEVIVYAKNSVDACLPKACHWIYNFIPKAIANNFDNTLHNYEGFVLKDLISGSFIRYKKPFTGDYVVTRCIKSDAKTLSGWGCATVGLGLYINGRLVEIGTAGGFIDDLKREMFQRPNKFVGLVAQFSGKGVFKSGRLRHPAFDRWRQDKKPEQCTMKQFDGLI